MELKIKKLHPNAILPTYGSAGAAGADLYALPEGDPITIAPGETVMIHTGLSMAIPEGYVGLNFARSGLASKRGLAPANKVGVIDSDYRGEVCAGLCNVSDKPYVIEPFERVAQMVIAPVFVPDVQEVAELSDTQRGEGGFGSTGRS